MADKSKMFLFALFCLLMTPVNALAIGFTLHKLWSWFCGALGPDPGLGAWYGVATMLSLIICMELVGVQRAKVDDYSSAIGRVLNVVLACAVTLGVSFASGKLFGWIG